MRGARDGLELWWWVVTDRRSVPGVLPPAGSIGPIDPATPALPPPAFEVSDLKSGVEEVLLPYIEREVPMVPAERERWKQSGLRLISVPAVDLPRIQSRLRTVGPAQRQWFGERPEWTDAVTGPSSELPRVVRVMEQTRSLPPGALRLLLRCWVAPEWATAEGGPGAVLRVEMIPEHHADEHRERRGLSLSNEGARVSSRPDLGSAFTELLSRVSLREGEACLIVPESPGVDWAEERPETSAEAPVQGFGPPSPAIPTLGEAMLSSAAFPDGGRRLRVVLVLVPHVPDRFQLTSHTRFEPVTE